MKKPRLDPLVMEDLVRAAMFMHWVTCQEQEEAKNGDLSFRNAIAAARDELNRNGSSLCGLDEFVERLKFTLTVDSAEFLRALEASRADDTERRARFEEDR